MSEPLLIDPRPSVGRIDECDLVDIEIDGLSYFAVRGDFTGYYATAAPYETNVLAPLLRDAAHARRIVDVGCNIGLVALPAARAMGAKGKVYCFDISQRNCRLLLANAKRNDLDNIVIYPIGAGVFFSSFPVATRQGSTLQYLSLVATDTLQASEFAFTAPLDALFAADGTRIDILKIDTDGYELRVLQGARAMLMMHRPSIYLEYSSIASLHQAGEPGDAILKLLDYYGYQVTVLHRDAPHQTIPAGPRMIDTVNQIWQRSWDAGITHIDLRFSMPQ